MSINIRTLASVAVLVILVVILAMFAPTVETYDERALEYQELTKKLEHLQSDNKSGLFQLKQKQYELAKLEEQKRNLERGIQ